MAHLRKTKRIGKRRASSSRMRTPTELDEVVLSPQPERPRHPAGQDRSRTKSTVNELPWSQFDRHISGLARTVSADFTVDAVVGVAHGGVFVGGALASALA